MLAIHHPEIYSAAGSMSGALDLTMFKEESEGMEALGSYRDQAAFWEESSALHLVENLRSETPLKLHLILDCGFNDYLLATNQKAHHILVKNNIPHEYIERSGGHDWTYWAKALPYQILFFTSSSLLQ